MTNIVFTYDQAHGSVAIGGRVRFYARPWAFGYRIEFLDGSQMKRVFMTVADAVNWFFRPVYFAFHGDGWGKASTMNGAVNEAINTMTKLEKEAPQTNFAVFRTINGSYVDDNGRLVLEGDHDEPFATTRREP